MVSLFAFSQQKKTVQSKSFSTKNKKITVYTTADSSKLRLTQTDILTFVPSKQPLEIEVSVFVEPSKTFQKFLGIGGAITDASAEVFAKLPKDKQKKFMDAYYDKEKGIGYSLL
ncbi:MAG: glycosyl hydrolase, partial [Flavobacterium sp.]|nr:glycosyl hydrolase [Flavobacterium sp.]